MSFGKNLRPGYLDPKKSDLGKFWIAHNRKRAGSPTHEKPTLRRELNIIPGDFVAGRTSSEEMHAHRLPN